MADNRPYCLHHDSMVPTSGRLYLVRRHMASTTSISLSTWHGQVPPHIFGFDTGLLGRGVSTLWPLPARLHCGLRLELSFIVAISGQAPNLPATYTPNAGFPPYALVSGQPSIFLLYIPQGRVSTLALLSVRLYRGLRLGSTLYHTVAIPDSPHKFVFSTL